MPLLHQMFKALCIGIVVLFLFCGCSRALNGEGKVSQRQNESNDISAKQKISDAIKKANETGQKEIAVYLDEDPDVVQTGDLVSLSGCAKTDKGFVIWSTDEEEMSQNRHGSVSNQAMKTRKKVEPIMAGEKTNIPGLSDHILGMRPGEKRKVILSAAEAFGEYDPGLVRRFPLVRHLPKKMILSRKRFEQHFGKEPVLGEDAGGLPYMTYKVTSIDGDNVVVAGIVEDGKTFKEEYGVVTVAVGEKDVMVTLKPEIGKAFPMGEKKGMILSSDDKEFTVNFNHPLAGTAITLELKVEGVVKFSTLRERSIHWLDNLDEGMELSVSGKKPSVLVLYANWCNHCHRLLEKTCTDPRVTYLSNEFVWIKIDSAENQGLKEMFDQKGFPTIVVMDPEGDIVDSFEGYQSPLAFGKRLQNDLLNMNNS